MFYKMDLVINIAAKEEQTVRKNESNRGRIVMLFSPFNDIP